MYTAHGIVTLHEWLWRPCSTQVERELSLSTCVLHGHRDHS
jgi:hypothetical protein